MIKAHHILLKDAVNTPAKLVCLRSPLNPHIHLHLHLTTMIAPVALIIYVSVQVVHMYLTMILFALETRTWRGKKEVIVSGGTAIIEISIYVEKEEETIDATRGSWQRCPTDDPKISCSDQAITIIAELASAHYRSSIYKPLLVARYC